MNTMNTIAPSKPAKPARRRTGRAARPDPQTQRGLAAVELALVIALMLLLLAGLIEFSRLFWHYNALAKASRDSARMLSVLPAAEMINPARAANARTAARRMVQDAADGAGIAGLRADDIEIACDAAPCSGTAPAPAHIGVAIHYRFTLGQWFPFIGGPDSGGYAPMVLSPRTTMTYGNE